MRAAVLHAPADLRVEEVARPTPGPAEVLVRVGAAGICGSDIGRVMVTGTYRFPMIPGHEFSGTVVEVGKNVAALAPGDRVAVAPLVVQPVQLLLLSADIASSIPASATWALRPELNERALRFIARLLSVR